MIAILLIMLLKLLLVDSHNVNLMHDATCSSGRILLFRVQYHK